MKLRGDRGDFQNQNKPCGSSRFLKKMWKIKNRNYDLAKIIREPQGYGRRPFELTALMNQRLLSGHFKGCSCDQTYHKIRGQNQVKIGPSKQKSGWICTSVTLRGDEKMADVMAGNSSADANGNEVSDVNAVSAAAGMPTNSTNYIRSICTQFYRSVVKSNYSLTDLCSTYFKLHLEQQQCNKANGALYCYNIISYSFIGIWLNRIIFA